MESIKYGGAGLPAEVTTALLAGRKIEAIRLLRVHTGIGLKEAKDRIEGFEVDPMRSPGEVPKGRWEGWIFTVMLALAVAYFFTPS